MRVKNAVHNVLKRASNDDIDQRPAEVASGVKAWYRVYKILRKTEDEVQLIGEYFNKRTFEMFAWLLIYRTKNSQESV